MQNLVQIQEYLRDGFAHLENASAEDSKFFLACYLLRQSGIDISAIESLLPPVDPVLHSVLVSRPAIASQDSKPNDDIPLWRLNHGQHNTITDVQEKDTEGICSYVNKSPLAQ